MILEHLHVTRLPGLPDAFNLVPGPGVNLLLGPNAAGKSSVARAVQGLFWPETYGGPGHEFDARFDGDLQAARTGGPAVTWRRAGEDVPAPAVPGDHLATCYRLGAPDLLVRDAGETDAVLARVIRKEMTGGVDLDALADDVPRVHKGKATTLGNLLNEASKRVLAVGREQEELDRRRGGMAGLEDELAAAVAAGREAAALAKALELATARAAAAAAETACEAFPPAVANAREEDVRDFESWQDTVADRKARIQELVRRQGETSRALAELALPAGADPDGQLTRLETRVQAANEAARNQAAAAEALAAAARTWQEARRVLADADALPDDDSLPGDREFSDLVDRHRAALTAKARGEALDRLAAEFAPDRVPSRTWPSLLLAVGILALATPVVPDLLSEALARVVLAVGLALAAGGTVLLVKTLRRHVLAERTEELASREDPPAPTVDGPWTLGRSLDDGGWLRDLDLLREAVRRRGDWQGAGAAAEQAGRALAEKLAACGTVVAAWGLSAPATADEAAEQLAELRRREEQRRRLVKELAAAGEDQASVKRERNRAGTRLAELLARLGLPAGTTDPAAVRGIVERLPEWEVADKRRQQARAGVAALEADAEVTDLARAGVAVLEARLAEARERAAAADDLREKLVRLQEQIAAAQKGHDRAHTLAEQERRRGDLADWRDEARANAVTAALLDELREAHDDLVTPPQLQRAKELFSGFTRRRYALKVASSGGTPVFRARDRNSDRWLELDELSGGTRAQLLLAVRLAFLDQAEAGPPLPLFLDESLTTADGERLAAIVAGLGVLARDTGRQVFYLTSNPADVGAWTDALAAAGLEAPTVLDLAEARRLPVAATAAQLARRGDFALPDPAELDVTSYGLAVGARRFDPGEEWSRADTIHLCGDDVMLVHRLRERGLTRAGVLDAALAEDDGLLTADRERLTLAMNVLKAFNRAWRRGRPRPVTAADIDASGAVTSTMREKVLELVAKHGGDGTRFLAALRNREVARFNRDKMDDLESYLNEAGCLDDREPRDGDGLVRAVQRTVRILPAEVRTLVLRLHAAAAATRPSG